MAQTTINVACLGDSITLSPAVRSVPPWPHLLERALGGLYSVGNYGKSSEVTAGMITTYNNRIKNKGFEYLVYMGGINDVLATTAAATIYSQIMTVINDAVGAGTKVILFTVLPALNYSGWNAGTMQPILSALNSSILGTTPAANLYIYDAFTDMQDTVTANQLSFMGGGGKPDYKTWIGNTTGDYLHPGQLGAPNIATLALAGIMALP